MLKFKEFLLESVDVDFTVEEAAWLYFFNIVYKASVDMKYWNQDKRMGENKAGDIVEKFKSLGLCQVEGLMTNFNLDKCLPILDKFFGGKDLQDAINKTYDYVAYKDFKSYPISNIPVDYYLRHKKPSLDKAFDRLSDLKTDWFNNWSQRIAAKIAKFRYLKEANLYAAWQHYYPDRIPEKIIIYRGLKSEYNKDMYSDEEVYYTSWTLNEKEAKRFATYHFTQYSFSKPVEANVQNILKAEVDLNDIILFYGGPEVEIIMLEPVKVSEIIKLK